MYPIIKCNKVLAVISRITRAISQIMLVFSMVQLSLEHCQKFYLIHKIDRDILRFLLDIQEIIVLSFYCIYSDPSFNFDFLSLIMV